MKAAEALARGATFPESFSVPDLEPVPRDEMALLMVREAAAVGTVIYNLLLLLITVSALCFSRITVNGGLEWMNRSCPGPPRDQR